MMRILLIGKNGQVGWELLRTSASLGDVIGVDFPEIDLTDPSNVKTTIDSIMPDIIINAAAYTAVDQAELDVDRAMAINGIAPGILAETAKKIGAALIHYSTDFVFDGTKTVPYIETDQVNPINNYGKSKLRGDVAVQEIGGAYIILRTSWVYSLRSSSFVGKVLKWSREQPELKVVDDQIGSPTWARLLAEITSQLLAQSGDDFVEWITDRRGLYHLAGSGGASRFEWAKAILEHDPDKNEQITQNVIPVKSSEFPTPARRPACSILDCKKFKDTFGLQLPPWESALKLAMGKL